MKNIKLDYYIFIEELNEIIIKNIKNLKKKKLKLTIIIIHKENFYLISKFAKKNKIPFYITNNIKFAIKNGAQGIFLTSENKILRNNIKETTKLNVIGSAHNQYEYFIKTKQKCSLIMLSPIFYNNKYSKNKILYPVKFNLITLNWNIPTCALGGINERNIKKINITKAKSIGIKSLISNN
jgi:thiamine monophosphate synthase